MEHQMSKSEKDTREGLQTLLAREHRELDQVFEALLAALQADAREDALQLWAAFDDGLCRHMALEERELLPLLRRVNAPEVEALLKEHDEIRARLTELGVGIDLHAIRTQTVRDFVQQLRRHARREDTLAYRWAKDNVPAARQEEMRRALQVARALRRRVMDLAQKVKSGVSASL